MRVVEKAPSGWWLAEIDGELGYFPGRYALPLRQGQQVFQVVTPYCDTIEGREVKLLRDQVRRLLKELYLFIKTCDLLFSSLSVCKNQANKTIVLDGYDGVKENRSETLTMHTSKTSQEIFLFCSVHG